MNITKNITSWTSSNTSVATINAQGTATFYNAGSTAITAHFNDVQGSTNVKLVSFGGSSC